MAGMRCQYVLIAQDPRQRIPTQASSRILVKMRSFNIVHTHAGLIVTMILFSMVLDAKAIGMGTAIMRMVLLIY